MQKSKAGLARNQNFFANESGYSQLQMKQTDAGTATLKSVLAKYPNSNAAKLARERLSRLSQQPAH